MKITIILSLVFFQYVNLHAVEFNGKFKQGSFIIGKTEPGNKITIDKTKIRVSKKGYFAFGLGRDRKNNVLITINNNGKKSN